MRFRARGEVDGTVKGTLKLRFGLKGTLAEASPLTLA